MRGKLREISLRIRNGVLRRLVWKECGMMVKPHYGASPL
jgi:hypothetical protein